MTAQQRAGLGKACLRTLTPVSCLWNRAGQAMGNADANLELSQQTRSCPQNSRLDSRTVRRKKVKHPGQGFQVNGIARDERVATLDQR